MQTDQDNGELELSPIFQVNKNKEENQEKKQKKNEEIENSKDDKQNAKTLMQIMQEAGVEDSTNHADVIEDARKTKFYFRKMQMMEGGSFIFALISIFLSVIEYDMRFKQQNTQIIIFLLILITICTIILVILTVIRYSVEIVLMKEQRLLSSKDDIITSGRIYSLLFELLIILPHPNVAVRGIKISSSDLYDQITLDYYLNDFLDIYILLRTFILFRVLLNTTEYASTRATRICRMYGCEPGYFYAAKCLMSETPLMTVTILFVFAILLGGQAIRICEEPLVTITPDDPKDFGIYLNCFWCMIITMSTVGYGDYYARTIPGRFVTLIASIVGVFLVSIMVVALTNTLNMNSAEQKARKLNRRCVIMDKTISDLIEEAANLLTSAAKFSLDNKKGRIPPNELKPRLQTVKQHAARFREANKQVMDISALKSMYDASNLSEEMARHFDHLKDDLREIYENQKQLRDYLLKLKRTQPVDEKQ